MTDDLEDGAPSLRRAQREVDESIVALGGYWAPLANLARLFEECGELARALNQTYGPKLIKSGEPPQAVAEELGDVLYVLLVLANSLHLDAEAALAGALLKARLRAADAERRQDTEQGGGNAPA
jgi:NTP pyrophosphatase (non-canonical NTP hydrolase)